MDRTDSRIADARALVAALATTALAGSIQLLPLWPAVVTDTAVTTALTVPLFAILILGWKEATRAMRSLPGAAMLVGIGGGCLAGGLVLDVDAVADTGKILLALVAGATATLYFERPSWVAGALLGIAASDAWSVWSSDGFTRQLQEGGGAVARLLVIELPGIGTTEPIGLFGVLDIVYVSFLLSVGVRWRLSLVRIAGALVVALLAVGVMVSIQSGFVPVLPFTSTAVVLALVPYLRAEWRWHRAGSRGWSSSPRVADSS